MKAFEELLLNTSTERAHWSSQPPDHKWIPDLAISHIIVSTLEGLTMKFPRPTEDLANIRCKYHAAMKDEQFSRRKLGA